MSLGVGIDGFDEPIMEICLFYKGYEITVDYMSDLFWLMDAQMARLAPFFPKSHGKPRIDDRRVISGIIFIKRNGLRWHDTAAAYGPHKTLYTRWKR